MESTLAFSQFNVSLNDSPEFVFFVISTVSVGLTVLGALVHIACAIAVYHDAMKLGTRTRANPTPLSTVMVGALVWAGGTLLLGLVGLALYWLVHHSSLSARRAFDADLTPVG
jgi:hypothetical protein